MGKLMDAHLEKAKSPVNIDLPIAALATAAPTEVARKIVRSFAELKPNKAWWEFLLAQEDITSDGCLLSALQLHCEGLVRNQAILTAAQALRAQFPQYKFSDREWYQKRWDDDTLDLIIRIVRDAVEVVIANPPVAMPVDASPWYPHTLTAQPNGFLPWRLFRHRRPASASAGVYLVGYFENRPDSETDPLTENVIYIGLAAGQTTGKRLCDFEASALGTIGHSGGWSYRVDFVPRFLNNDYQLLERFHNTYCSWKDIHPNSGVTPRQVEKQLIADFRARFGRRPLLNRQD